MKKIDLCFLFLSLLGSTSLYAQDLVFNMTEEQGIEIINKSCRFDPANKCIGNTDGGTTVCLGEIDFGDGYKYAGTGIVQAQEIADMTGYVDIYFGDPDNGGELINDLQLKGTGAWQLYKTYRYNFYPEGSDIIRPTGKGKVYLRMRSGEDGDGQKYYCNVKRVFFYTTELSEEEQGLMADPTFIKHEYDIADADIVDTGSNDAHLNDGGALGWTSDGVTAKISSVDFGDGSKYGQFGVHMAHQGTSLSARINVYVDDASNEDNLIASVWTGRDIGWSNFMWVADDLIKAVSGVHDVYCVWQEPADVKGFAIIEGKPLEVEYGLEYVKEKQEEDKNKIEVKLSNQAYIMTFDDMGGVENAAEIMAEGSSGAHFQSDNIGYTSNGVVVKLKDVDFKDGEFKRIVIESATDQSNADDSFFDIYLDIPEDNDFSNLSFLNEQTKLASVPVPATGNWSKKELTEGTMTSEVKGVHDLYVVWNVSNGSNVFKVALDWNFTDGIAEVETTRTLISAGKGFIRVKSKTPVIVYTVAGAQVANAVGNSVVSVPAGLYIVKTGQKAVKVLVD